MKVDLLEHNQEAYGKIKSLIAEGKKKIAISHATGTGKSYLVAKLFEDYSNDKKLVLAPSRYIKEQMQGLFEKYDIKNADIILYQKLIRMPDEDIVAMDYQVIALDEYHHDAATKVWGEKVGLLINSHPESIIFGTSATPVRTDGVNAIDALFEGNCASDLSLPESIAKKIVPLPKYVGALYTLDDELEKLRKKVEGATNSKEEKQEFYKKINAMRGSIEKSYGMPIILNKHIKDKEGKYIVFCKNKKHLDEIKDTVIGWFHTAGFKDIHSYVVHSSYEGKDKEYKAFCDDTSHTLKLLFSVDMLNEGLHLENISGVLLLRPTNSSIVWHQQIGRAIEANNVSTPVIIDAVNNFSSVGQGMELLKEIKDAVTREKEGNPEFDDSDFMDIDTFFVLEQVLDIQEMFKEIEGRLEGRAWTEEEIEILKKWYPVEGIKVKNRLKGRTKSAIRNQVRELDLKAPDISWTEEENDILRKYYPIEGCGVVDRLNGRTKKATARQARIIGLKAPDISWTEEENDILKKYYQTEGTKVENRLKGRTIGAIKSQAEKLGLNIYKPWTVEENAILKKYYPVEGMKVVNRLEGRTKKAIYTQISSLGINIYKVWTDEENDILREWYPLEGTKVANRLNDRTKSAIRTQARRLDLKAPDISWTEEENDILGKYYPIEGLKVTDRLEGRTKKAVEGQLKRLGLVVSNKWTEEENKVLRKYYSIEGTLVKNRLRGRTKSAIKSQAYKLGLKNSNKKWTEEEIKILRTYFPIDGMRVVERLEGRTESAIRSQVHNFALKFKKNRYIYKRGSKFVVMFRVDGKNVRFGTFDSEEEAAKVAMEKAKELGRVV